MLWMKSYAKRCHLRWVLLATEAKKLKDAAEKYDEASQEVMTDNDVSNDGQTDMNLSNQRRKF